MQENSNLKEWIADNIDETPSVKPRSLPTIYRYGLMLSVAILSGCLQSHTEWPLWAHYSIVGGVALILGLAQGLWAENELWHAATRQWHPLLRRLASYQAVCWTAALVLFLFGFDCLQNIQHFLAFLLVALLLSGGVWWAKHLLNTFSCPHCQHPYFGKKTKWEFVDGFLLFGMNKWPRTHCQHCDWPLWKSTDAP